jgi:hypothetical protein
MTNKLLSQLAVVAIAALSGTAQAVPIQFVTTGGGSGTLNGVAFSGGFTINSFGDTATRNSPFAGVFSIVHSSSFINIAGIGQVQILEATRTFVNQSGTGLVGYSRGGGSGADLYNGPTSALFSTWDMTTSIGPVSGAGNLLQWGGGLNTDHGLLAFSNGFSDCTFTATVPAPAAGLSLVGGLMVATRRRR